MEESGIAGEVNDLAPESSSPTPGDADDRAPAARPRAPRARRPRARAADKDVAAGEAQAVGAALVEAHGTAQPVDAGVSEPPAEVTLPEVRPRARKPRRRKSEAATAAGESGGPEPVGEGTPDSPAAAFAPEMGVRVEISSVEMAAAGATGAPDASIAPPVTTIPDEPPAAEFAAPPAVPGAPPSAVPVLPTYPVREASVSNAFEALAVARAVTPVGASGGTAPTGAGAGPDPAGFGPLEIAEAVFVGVPTADTIPGEAFTGLAVEPVGETELAPGLRRRDDVSGPAVAQEYRNPLEALLRDPGPGSGETSVPELDAERLLLELAERTDRARSPSLRLPAEPQGRELFEADPPVVAVASRVAPTPAGTGPVVVPEALLEQTPDLLFEALAADQVTVTSPLLSVTPELLEELRADEEAPPPRGRRDRGRSRRNREQALAETSLLAELALLAEPQGAAGLGAAVPAPPTQAAPVLPDYVLVAEALLEAPDDTGLEPVAAVPDAPAEDGAQADDGRRRRRRGRGRERDRTRAEEVPAVEEAPPVVIARAEPEPSVEILSPAPEEAFRSDRDGRRRRDRDRGDRDRGDRSPVDVERVERFDPEPREREISDDREYKEILINVDDRETRIAVLEQGRLVELHVEREERVVGGVYKGRVVNVLAGMDCAFVDIGLDRNAFLYVGDILFDAPRSRNSGAESPARRTSRDVRIRDLVKPGQELMLQVVKGPHGTKGARVSTRISIPGRYLVLMPEGDHQGVSRKIEDARERERLRRIADELQPRGFGLIVRTEAEGRTEEDLRQDLDYLVSTWRAVSDKNRRQAGPCVLQKDLGLILKTIRDLFGSDTDRLVVDSAEEHEKIVETLNQLAPDLADRVVLYDEPEPLFARYNVEEEIERLLRRKVWMKNGAYLLIDTTEALTTIDVNTGKFVGTSSLAETILRTNLDAVDEIARQLRLRDIGGMIVLDFIDMASSRDRQLVMRALETAFRRDRTRTKVAHISPLGLVEMTRKRTQENVMDALSHPCPYCQGRGRVWSPETISIQIEREIRNRSAKEPFEALLVYANPETATCLIGAEGDGVDALEQRIGRPIYVRSRPDYHFEQYEVLSANLLEMEQEVRSRQAGETIECHVVKGEVVQAPRSAAWADGYFLDVGNAVRFQGQSMRVRLTQVGRSYALAEPV